MDIATQLSNFFLKCVQKTAHKCRLLCSLKSILWFEQPGEANYFEIGRIYDRIHAGNCALCCDRGSINSRTPAPLRWKK